MAKGLRASTERSNRTALRAKVFKPVEDARANRLNARLQEIIAQPLPERSEMDLDTEANTKVNENPGEEPTKDVEAMEVDNEPKSSKKSANRSRSASKVRQGGRVQKGGRIQKSSHRKKSAQVVFPKKVKLLGASKKQK